MKVHPESSTPMVVKDKVNLFLLHELIIIKIVEHVEQQMGEANAADVLISPANSIRMRSI